jgi:2-keto-4-pentenoate hydratase
MAGPAFRKGERDALPGAAGRRKVIPVTDRTRLAAVAEELWDAEQLRRPISPITDKDPDLTVEDAYAIQTINVERRVAAGARQLGSKVGLSAKAMQQLLGVNEPDFGVLLDDMFVEEGDPISLSTMLQPRIEAEIGFVLEHDLAGPGVTTAAALRAIAGAMPALEIVDSRIADWKIKLVDTVADNASCGRVVLGGRITKIDGLDLRLLGMVLSRNGDTIDTGAGAAVLGNPARCVAWLANKFATFGASLHAGDVVIPGALHRMVPVAAGDSFRADFAHLGSVTTLFTA